jgi:hypothetical protein
VGDAREVADREPCCHQAIVNPPLTGQSTAPDSTEVIEHYGDTIVRGRYDGTFDKTNLPDELILTGYFTVRDGKIVSLIVIHNIPAAW